MSAPQIPPEKLQNVAAKILNLNKILNKDLPSLKSGKLDRFLRQDHGFFVAIRSINQIRRKNLLFAFNEIQVHAYNRKTFKQIILNMIRFIEIANKMKKHRFLLQWRVLIGDRRYDNEDFGFFGIITRVFRRKKRNAFVLLKRNMLANRIVFQDQSTPEYIVKSLVKLDYFFSKKITLYEIFFNEKLKELNKKGIDRGKDLIRSIKKLTKKRVIFIMQRLLSSHVKAYSVNGLHEVLDYLRKKSLANAFFRLFTKAKNLQDCGELIRVLEKIWVKKSWKFIQEKYWRYKFILILKEIMYTFMKRRAFYEIQQYAMKKNNSSVMIERLCRIINIFIKRRAFGKIKDYSDWRFDVLYIRVHKLIQILFEDYQTRIKEEAFQIIKKHNSKNKIMLGWNIFIDFFIAKRKSLIQEAFIAIHFCSISTKEKQNILEKIILRLRIKQSFYSLLEFSRKTNGLFKLQSIFDYFNKKILSEAFYLIIHRSNTMKRINDGLSILENFTNNKIKLFKIEALEAIQFYSLSQKEKESVLQKIYLRILLKQSFYSIYKYGNNCGGIEKLSLIVKKINKNLAYEAFCSLLQRNNAAISLLKLNEAFTKAQNYNQKSDAFEILLIYMNKTIASENLFILIRKWGYKMVVQQLFDYNEEQSQKQALLAEKMEKMKEILNKILRKKAFLKLLFAWRNQKKRKGNEFALFKLDYLMKAKLKECMGDAWRKILLFIAEKRKRQIQGLLSLENFANNLRDSFKRDAFDNLLTNSEKVKLKENAAKSLVFTLKKIINGKSFGKILVYCDEKTKKIEFFAHLFRIIEKTLESQGEKKAFNKIKREYILKKMKEIRENNIKNAVFHRLCAYVLQKRGKLLDINKIFLKFQKLSSESLKEIAFNKLLFFAEHMKNGENLIKLLPKILQVRPSFRKIKQFSHEMYAKSRCFSNLFMLSQQKRALLLSYAWYRLKSLENKRIHERPLLFMRIFLSFSLTRKIREKQWGFKALILNLQRTKLLENMMNLIKKNRVGQAFEALKEKTSKEQAAENLLNTVKRAFIKREEDGLERIKTCSANKLSEQRNKLAKMIELMQKARHVAMVVDKLQTFYRIKQNASPSVLKQKILSNLFALLNRKITGLKQVAFLKIQGQRAKSNQDNGLHLMKSIYSFDNLVREIQRRKLNDAFQTLKNLLNSMKGLNKLANFSARKSKGNQLWSLSLISRRAFMKLKEENHNNEDSHSQEPVKLAKRDPFSRLKPLVDILQRKSLGEPFIICKIAYTLQKNMQRLKKFYRLFDIIGYKRFVLLTQAISQLKKKPSIVQRLMNKPVQRDQVTKHDAFSQDLHLFSTKDKLFLNESLGLSPINNKVFEKASASPLRVKPVKPSGLAEKLKGKKDLDNDLLGNEPDIEPKEKEKKQGGNQDPLLKESLAGTNDDSSNFNRIDNLLAWSKAKRKNINENYLANPENKENKTTSFHNQNSFLPNHPEEDEDSLNPFESLNKSPHEIDLSFHEDEDNEEEEEYEGQTLNKISQVLERHIKDQASKSKLLEILCLKQKQETNQCEICGKDLELLRQIDSLCQQDIELKVLVYRRFLRVPLKTMIYEPTRLFAQRIISRRMELSIGPLGSLSPIFNKPTLTYLG